ncbi:hypothetical protein Tel_00470 [Candidatus Tenderia electrophaga]|jgi:hypothetical protein|uniref:Uncharacterized protein n=1 Tax=Candidatus Tenderia electrophaga TaxID=1748243 RepID=A0A0S2T9B4_9GAMM|nr:hypothetical protein Tel_00470 [Candidatus Tenderia electrophaga]
MNNRLLTVIMGTVAIGAGVLVNFFGDKLLGVRLELFWGVGTFSPLWVLDLFLVPFIAGAVVSFVYGLGGKLLCYFVPIIVRGASYIQMAYYDGLPEGMVLLPLGYWVLILIVAIEAAAFGGVFGEIMVKKTYGRRPKHLLYKQRSDNGPVSSDK